MRNFFRGLRLLCTEFHESLRMAFEEVLHHKTRAALTALGVMIGVLAVSLMGTAVSGIDKGFNDSLAMIGTDVFYVGRWPWGGAGRDWRLYIHRPQMREEFAAQVNEIISESQNSNLELAVSREEKHRSVRYERNSVDSVTVIGTEASFMQVSPMQMESGRFFSDAEGEGGFRVVVIGADIAKALFPNVSPIGKKIVIQNQPFEVIGVFVRQGSFMGLFSMDSMVVVPRKSSPSARRDHRDIEIMVKAKNGANMAAAADELEGIMRRIRCLAPEDNNDFEINRAESIEKELGPVKTGITLAGLFITGLSLFVGAIGIMNITFVSVRERTREIGTRRAIGAPRRAILAQFLVEAVLICIIGGIVGLGLTYVIQTAAKHAFPTLPLLFSAKLLLIAIGVSVLTGVFSGFAPAWTASKLDPAEALRHD
jgi:putative ABC transport system permease protein